MILLLLKVTHTFSILHCIKNMRFPCTIRHTIRPEFPSSKKEEDHNGSHWDHWISKWGSPTLIESLRPVLVQGETTALEAGEWGSLLSSWGAYWNCGGSAGAIVCGKCYQCCSSLLPCRDTADSRFPRPASSSLHLVRSPLCPWCRNRSVCLRAHWSWF